VKLIATAALTLVTAGLAATSAEAFHPFDQPSGYQMPRWIEKRTAKPKDLPATAKPKPLFQLPSAAAQADADEQDGEPAPQSGKPVATKYPPLLEGGPRPAIAPVAPPTVAFNSNYGTGTVVIDTAGRALYYVLSPSSALKYPISVGRVGFTWTGTETISRVASWPDWRPPQEMKQRVPGLPDVMTGGIRNPLGAKALYLGNSLYRIHGTNDAKTIGQAASSGCFRMLNGHVTHLAQRVGVGTTVKVLSKLPSNVASSGKGSKGGAG